MSQTDFFVTCRLLLSLKVSTVLIIFTTWLSIPLSSPPSADGFTQSSVMANTRPDNTLLFRESEAIDLEDEPAPELDRALNLTLAGKLLTVNRPSLSNLTYFASKTWECPSRLKAYDHGGGLYSFEFVLESDVLRVLEGGPWYMEGKLLLIQRVNPNLAINQLPFESTKLWVRCYGLPPKAFNLKFAKAIGNKLGCFCDSDLREDGGENMMVTVTVRKYLRIKVTVNLAAPLKRSQSIRIRNSTENKVDVITARLPLFCYRCGILGHEVDNCVIEGPVLYGDWIRAEKYYRAPAVTGNANATQEIPNPVLIPDNPPEAANPITLEPNIILANFRQYREEGNIPPVPPTVENTQFGSFNQALIALEGSSTGMFFPQLSYVSSEAIANPISAAAPTVQANSILGAAPITKAKPSLPPIYPSNTNATSKTAPSYYNPFLPSADLFSPSTQRCLFKTDLLHPALSTQTRAATTSPPDLSPIGSSPSTFLNVSDTLELPAPLAAGGDVKGKGTVHVKGKRASNASSSKKEDTPRPKRGRPAGTSKNA